MKNRWIAPLSSLVIVFVLAACSNVGTTGGTASPTVTGTAAVTAASPTATATATTAASPAGTSPAAATATAATTGGARDVCSLLQRPDVEAVVGTLITQPAKVDVPLPGFTASACIYASSDGTLTVALGPRAIGRTEFESVVRLAPGATAVTGIADSAFSVKVDVPSGAAGAAGIVALKGATYYTVQATHRSKSSDALLTAVTDLAKKVATAL